MVDFFQDFCLVHTEAGPTSPFLGDVFRSTAAIPAPFDKNHPRNGDFVQDGPFLGETC